MLRDHRATLLAGPLNTKLLSKLAACEPDTTDSLSRMLYLHSELFSANTTVTEQLVNFYMAAEDTLASSHKQGGFAKDKFWEAFLDFLPLLDGLHRTMILDKLQTRIESNLSSLKGKTADRVQKQLSRLDLKSKKALELEALISGAISQGKVQ